MGIEADYLGQLCAQLVLTVSPQRIIMGGGVMSQQRLFPLVRQRMRHWLGGYIDRREILEQPSAMWWRRRWARNPASWAPGLALTAAAERLVCFRVCSMRLRAKCR